MSSSNWAKLKQKLDTNAPAGDKKRKHTGNDSSSSFKRSREETTAPSRADAPNSFDSEDVTSKIMHSQRHIPPKVSSKYVGLDCEMVGIGSSGKQSVLARACLVDFDGQILYDQFVRPSEFVTDFRTEYSGVRRRDLRQGHAVSLAECQESVARLLKGKILVGHALHNDMKVLLLSHPHTRTRDTARYKPYMRPHGRKGGKFKPRALRDLAKQFLRTTIQAGEHDPSIDARTAMFLYRLRMDEWEGALLTKARGAAAGPGEDSSTSTAAATEQSAGKSQGKGKGKAKAKKERGMVTGLAVRTLEEAKSASAPEAQEVVSVATAAAETSTAPVIKKKKAVPSKLKESRSR